MTPVQPLELSLSHSSLSQSTRLTSEEAPWMFFFPLGVLTRADIMWKRDKLSLLCPFQILEMQDSEQIKLLFFFFNGEIRVFY